MLDTFKSFLSNKIYSFKCEQKHYYWKFSLFSVDCLAKLVFKYRTNRFKDILWPLLRKKEWTQEWLVKLNSSVHPLLFWQSGRWLKSILKYNWYIFTSTCISTRLTYCTSKISCCSSWKPVKHTIQVSLVFNLFVEEICCSKRKVNTKDSL